MGMVWLWIRSCSDPYSCTIESLHTNYERTIVLCMGTIVIGVAGNDKEQKLATSNPVLAFASRE
jgi:hypothetical protein